MAEDLLERLYIALFYFCQYEKFVQHIRELLLISKYKKNYLKSNGIVFSICSLHVPETLWVQ